MQHSWINDVSVHKGYTHTSLSFSLLGELTMQLYTIWWTQKIEGLSVNKHTMICNFKFQKFRSKSKISLQQ